MDFTRKQFVWQGVVILKQQSQDNRQIYETRNIQNKTQEKKNKKVYTYMEDQTFAIITLIALLLFKFGVAITEKGVENKKNRK